MKIEKTDAQWRELLAAKNAESVAFEVTRKAATERPFTGKYESHWEDGSYHCMCCNAKLFDSDTKFDAHCGWPSFTAAVDDSAIDTTVDRSHFMVRTEVHCARCEGHLGHIFPDGPAPTGMRHCINGVSLKFVPDEG